MNESGPFSKKDMMRALGVGRSRLHELINEPWFPQPRRASVADKCLWTEDDLRMAVELHKAAKIASRAASIAGWHRHGRAKKALELQAAEYASRHSQIKLLWDRQSKTIKLERNPEGERALRKWAKAIVNAYKAGVLEHEPLTAAELAEAKRQLAGIIGGLDGKK